MTQGSHEQFSRLIDTPTGTEEFKTKTVRSGAYAMTGEAVDFVLRLASVVILARLLAPEYFGLISMVTAVTAIADRFKDLGLASATIQSPTLTYAQLSTLFWVNTLVGIVMAGAVAALAYPIALFYGDPRLTYITLAIATSFLWSGAANQHHALLRRTMRFRQIAVIQVAASALSIVVAVAMAIQGLGYWALVAREVSRNVFVSVGAWICFPWMPGLPSMSSGVGRMLRFGADITGFNVAFFISQSMDQVLIGRIFGAHALGIYRQGYQLVLAPMNQIAYPVRVVTESALSRLQTEVEAYQRYYRNILKAVSLVTIPLGLFMAVYAEEIVAVVLGEQWLDAIPIFRVLAIAAFLQPAGATAGAVMISCGHSRRFFWLGLLSSVVLVLLFVAGIPYGPTGVASAHIWALWLLLVPKLYWSFKNTPVSVGIFFSSIARPLAAGTAMVAVSLAFKSVRLTGPDAAGLAGDLAVAAAVYLGACLLIPGGRAELTGLVSGVAEPLGLSRFLPAWATPAANNRLP
ncbi:MAG: lipopolysaccharide biosynthesis protein [Bryobacterales bacterium]|nr:lipopolysaccharide biosynthesis protein [Bryobacterales bacterium]